MPASEPSRSRSPVPRSWRRRAARVYRLQNVARASRDAIDSLSRAIDSLNRATAVAAHSEQLTVESAQLALELAEIKHHTETTRQRIAFLENRLDNAEHTLEQLIEATHIVVPPAEATGANKTSTAEQAAPARADGL